MIIKYVFCLFDCLCVACMFWWRWLGPVVVNEMQTPSLKKNRFHFFVHVLKRLFLIFAIYIFWDIIVHKWEFFFYLFSYKNKKDEKSIFRFVRFLLFLSYGRFCTQKSSKNLPIFITKTTISQKLKIGKLIFIRFSTVCISHVNMAYP